MCPLYFAGHIAGHIQQVFGIGEIDDEIGKMRWPSTSWTGTGQLVMTMMIYQLMKVSLR